MKKFILTCTLSLMISFSLSEINIVEGAYDEYRMWKDLATFLGNANVEQEFITKDPSVIFEECHGIKYPNTKSVYAVFNRQTNELGLIGDTKKTGTKADFRLIDKISIGDFVGIMLEISCRGNEICIEGKWAFRNTYIQKRFRWNGKKLIFLNESYRDYSEEVIKESLRHALEGNLIAAKNSLGGVLYPQQYLGNASKLVVEALKKGADKALILHRQKKDRQSIKILETIFDYTYALYKESKSLGHSNYPDLEELDIPEKWIMTWKTLDIDMEAFIRPLNDYGFYLFTIGNNEKAVSVLNHVLKEDPNRTPGYLNLADAYWMLGHEENARQNYRIYIDKMKQAGNEKAIPSRILSRVK